MERRRVMEPLGMAGVAFHVIGTALKFYASLLCNNRNRAISCEKKKKKKKSKRKSMLGRLQKESMSDPKNPFFLSFFFLHLVTTEREIVSSESPCFRFNPLASLKLRLVSFHDAWSPVQFLTRASRFLTPFPFTSPSIFSRAAYLAFLSVVEIALVVTRRSPAARLSKPFNLTRFPRSFRWPYRPLCPLNRQKIPLSSRESITRPSSLAPLRFDAAHACCKRRARNPRSRREVSRVANFKQFNSTSRS